MPRVLSIRIVGSDKPSSSASGVLSILSAVSVSSVSMPWVLSISIVGSDKPSRSLSGMVSVISSLVSSVIAGSLFLISSISDLGLDKKSIVVHEKSIDSGLPK